MIWFVVLLCFGIACYVFKLKKEMDALNRIFDAIDISIDRIDATNFKIMHDLYQDDNYYEFFRAVRDRHDNKCRRYNINYNENLETFVTKEQKNGKD